MTSTELKLRLPKFSTIAIPRTADSGEVHLDDVRWCYYICFGRVPKEAREYATALTSTLASLIDKLFSSIESLADLEGSAGDQMIAAEYRGELISWLAEKTKLSPSALGNVNRRHAAVLLIVEFCQNLKVRQRNGRLASVVERLRRAQYKSEAKIAEDDLVSSRMSALIFQQQRYFEANPDVAASELPAWRHYIDYGRHEGRALHTEAAGSALVGLIEQNYDKTSEAFRLAYLKSHKYDCRLSKVSVNVFTHSRGNYFMLPISEALCRSLRSLGIDARLRTELSEPPLSRDLNIVMAPHEFFEQPLPPGYRSLEFRRSAILFNTEQVPSKYFSTAMREMSVCRAAIDVNFHTSVLLQRVLPTCFFLPPFDDKAVKASISLAQLDHPLFASLDAEAVKRCDASTPIDDRCIDIFFAGFANDYRDSFFIREAAFLSSKECFFAYTRLRPKPASGGIWNETVFHNNIQVACASKVVLSIHRYPTGYFEWERMIAQGFASGTCVVATPGIRCPFFEPGKHYIEVPLRHFGVRLRQLLETASGRSEMQKIATAGRQRLEEVMSDFQTGQYLCSFLAAF